jgi:CBS domain-containing protein
MKVEQAMHQGVTWCEPDTPIAELATKMRDEDIGAIPIGENDKLIGMVTDRDLACRGLTDSQEPAALTARDVMTKGIVFCRTGQDVEDAIRVMEIRRVRRLPVIDDNKRMVGMLALGDLSQKISATLSREAIRAVSAHHA